MRTKHVANGAGELTKIAAVTIAILVILGLFSFGCTDKCEVDRLYTYYKPVYQTTEEIRASVSFGAPKSIAHPGKIFFKDDVLFINEVGEGIHLIDNSNPTVPRQLGFIHIPGNFDMAAKGDMLYADSYIDLLVFDISDVRQVEQLTRIDGAFENFANLPFYFDSWSGVVTSFELTSVEEIAEEECSSSNIVFVTDDAFLGGANSEKSFDYLATNGSTPPTTSTGDGVAGSMSRFAVYQNYLYTIDATSLYLFDISDAENPVAGPRIDVEWGIETLFPYKDKLFIGASSGMHIYDNSDPAAPVHLSTYAHIQSCDPVVVEDDYAFVTLRSGTVCQGFTNQLEIVDISDLRKPTLFKSYPMENPHGLGVDGKCLFICEGEFGLKLYDKTDLQVIDEHLVAHFSEIDAFDVIPLNGLLMMIGQDGLFQYEYDCEGKLELLSAIPIVAL